MTIEFEVLETFDDARGTAFEPVGSEALAGFRNVHVVLTEPGHVRGNHRHARGVETLIVRGPALLVTDEGGARETREIAQDQVVRVRLGPGVAHAVKNTGDRPMLIVSFGTEPFDPTNTERHVLLA